jgi:carbohydrate-binding DOMON domain-containing protein
MTGFRDASNYQLIHVYTKSSTTSGSPTIGTQNLIIDGVGYNESIRGTIVTTDSAAVPEIDPATGSGALALVAGMLAILEQRREQRRRRAKVVA